MVYERTGSYDVVWWLAIAVRCAVGADQPADRREAGGAASAAAGLGRSSRRPCAGHPRYTYRRADVDGRRRP